MEYYAQLIIEFCETKMVGRFVGENASFYGKHHSAETKEKLSELHSEPVNQYDMQGRFLQQFRSAREASESTGISTTSISYTVLGKTRFAGNYLWKKTSEEFPVGVDVDASAILGNGKQTGHKKRVQQYTLEGSFVREYESLKDAADAVGARVTNISAVAYGRAKTCRGYKWTFSE